MSCSPDRTSEDFLREGSLAKNLNSAFELTDESVECQDENMNVFVRLRPLLKEEEELGYTECISVHDSKTVLSTVPADSAKFKNLHYKPSEKFKFNKAFNQDENQFVFFENTMKDVIQSFIDGSNSLVFTYGSSGSGKTFTMQGTSSEPGILPLTVQLIFELMKDKITMNPKVKPEKHCDIIQLSSNETNVELEIKASLLRLMDHEDSDSYRSDKVSQTNIFTDDISHISDLADISSMKISTEMSLSLQNNSSYGIWVSFIEIYNERMYDLLQPLEKKRRQRLVLAEDKQGNIYVKNLREVVVHNCHDVLTLLRVGRRNLKIASTKLNYQSSRSHCIFNIKVIRTSMIENVPYVKVNLLSFCDLAGSERCCKTNNTGIRLKEAGNINTSLMVLGRCIEALRYNQLQKEKRIVPFRESKLTRLFAGFFTGKGKASMIVNISPSSYTFDETLHTLKFSALAKEVMMIDNLALSHLTENFSKTYARLSIGMNDSAVDENGEGEGDSISVNEEYAAVVQEIVEAAKKYEAENMMLKQDRVEFESNLRSEISGHYEIQIQRWRQRYDKLFAFCNEQSNKRLRALIDRLAEHADDSESESEDEEELNEEMEVTDESTNEKDAPPASSSEQESLRLELQEKISAIEKLESQVTDLKSQIENRDKAMQETNVMVEKSADLLLQKEKLLGEQALQLEQLENQASLHEKEFESAKASAEKHLAELMTKTKESEAKVAQINKLQKDLAQQEEKLQLTEDDIEKYISVISQKNTELQKLNSDVENLECALKAKGNQERTLYEDSTKQLAAKDIQIKELKDQIEVLKTKVRRSDESLKDARGHLVSTNNDHNKALNYVKELEEKLQDKEKLEKTLKESNEALKKKKDEIAELKQKLEKLKTDCDSNVKLLETAKKNITAHNLDYKEALEKIKVLEQSLAEKEKDLKEGLLSSKQQAQISQDKLEVLSQEIEDLKKVIVVRDEEIQCLKQDQQQLNQNLSSKENKFSKQMESTVQELNAFKEREIVMKKHHADDIIGFEQKIMEKAEQMQILEQNSKKLSGEIKVLKTALEDSEKGENELQNELSELKQTLESKQSIIDVQTENSRKTQEKLQNEMDELKKSLESKQSIIDSQLSDSERLTQEMKALKVTLEEAIEAETSVRMENIELKNVAATKDLLIQNNEQGSLQVIAELKAEIEDLKQSLASKDILIDSQVKDSTEMVETLKTEIAGLTESLSSTQAIIDSQTKDFKDQLAELNEEKTNLEMELANKEKVIESNCEEADKKVDLLTKQVADLEKKIASTENISTPDNVVSESKELAVASSQTDIPYKVLQEELQATQQKVKDLEKNEMDMKRMLGERTESIQDLETALINLQSPLQKVVPEKRAKVSEEIEEPPEKKAKGVRLGRGKTSRLVAAATSVLTPIRKVAEATSSLIPTPSRRPEASTIAAVRRGRVASKLEVAPVTPRSNLKLLTPIVKKLRSRTTKVSYVDSPDVAPTTSKMSAEQPIPEAEEISEPPKKKKAVERKSEMANKSEPQKKPTRQKETSNVQKRTYRQRAVKNEPVKSSPRTSSHSNQAEEQSLPSKSAGPSKTYTKKNTKTTAVRKSSDKTSIASALAYLDPSATSTPVQTLQTRGKKRLYVADRQSMVKQTLITPISVRKKSPATVEKSAQEVIRQINTRRQRR